MQTVHQETLIRSRAFRLIQPGTIRETMLEHPLKPGHVAVEPTLGSICHADLRYFSGNRRPEALAKKLPMALIHEGIGKVVESNGTRLREGQRVMIVPNIPGHLMDRTEPAQCCPACSEGVGDNYCYRGKFLGSGYDGIAQSRIVVPAECAVPIPDSLADDIAVLAELCSVSYHAVSRVRDRLSAARVAVFGDGPVGYLTAAMVHHGFGVPQGRLSVFGAISEKLDQFRFAERHLVTEYDFGALYSYDIAIECTGGKFSEEAINQAIQILKPGGTLILMGVTEERVPVNTREVLEKKLTLTGSSRSSHIDFLGLLPLLQKPEYQATLRLLLPDERRIIRSPEDFANTMEEAMQHRGWKKMLLEFHW
jgi:ribitol-5-phosphate 2-dehydrogenase